MYKTLFATIVPLAISAVMATSVCVAGDKTKDIDEDLAADLALMQGTWELDHENKLNGLVTNRDIRTIEGNRETVQRFDRATGERNHEHSVEFSLSKSGNVRVFTFYPVGGSPENGASYIYKVDKKNFFEVSGLLQGEGYNNYRARPRTWYWKRVPNQAPDQAGSLVSQSTPPAPRLALDGNCAVSLVELNAVVKGEEKFQSLYRGLRYYFLSEEEKQVFDACPELFAVAYGGIDIVASYGPDSQAKEASMAYGEGDRTHRYQHRTYLFANEQNFRAFVKEPDHFIQRAQQALYSEAKSKRGKTMAQLYPNQ